jgi:DNA-directed RNA polymerase specialized sigma24 family protein
MHRVLREVLRHYVEYKEHVGNTGNHVIEHGYYIYEDDGETIKDKISVTLSFWDLHRGIKELSPRKKEALFYNVIMDMKQRDVAEEMEITTVSVGQYVEQATIQLAEEYFSEEIAEQEKDKTDEQMERAGRAR